MSLTVAGNIQKDIAVAVFISDNQSLNQGKLQAPGTLLRRSASDSN